MNPKLYNATLDLVKSLHGDQVRKYTGEPYWTHCEAVAKKVMKHGGDPIMIAAALCHDVMEDTECKGYLTLVKKLQEIGWSGHEAYGIVGLIDDLTDQYTTEAYPNMNRAWRKKKEAERLAKVPPEAQTIKYADLIDNTMSIATHDPKFARVYLKEKAALLDVMRDGDPALYQIARQVWEGAARRARVSGAHASNGANGSRPVEQSPSEYRNEAGGCEKLDRNREVWLRWGGGAR